MMVKIGLYWQHDLDLVALYMHPDFEFTKWMKLMVLYANIDFPTPGGPPNIKL